jgi:hypothetical protein
MPLETFTWGEYDYLGSAIIAIAFSPRHRTARVLGFMSESP